MSAAVRAVPIVLHYAERSRLAASEEIPLARKHPPLERQDVLQGVPRRKTMSHRHASGAPAPSVILKLHGRQHLTMWQDQVHRQRLSFAWCFSKSFRESSRGTRANRYSICSAGVGFAKGPRRTVAKISAERLLCRDRRAPPRLTTSAPGGQRTGRASSRCASGRGGGRYRDHGLHEAALGVVANRA